MKQPSKGALMRLYILIVAILWSQLSWSTPYREAPHTNRATARLRTLHDLNHELLKLRLQVKNILAPNTLCLQIVVHSLAKLSTPGEQKCRTDSATLVKVYYGDQDLQFFENEDQLVGFSIYSALVNTLDARMHNRANNLNEPNRDWDPTKTTLEFGKLDLEAMDAMLQHGYDPREFLKWYNLAAVKIKTNSGARHPLQAHVFTITDRFPNANLRTTRMTAWLMAKEAKQNFPTPRSLSKDIERLAHPNRALHFTNEQLLEHLLADHEFQNTPVPKKIHILSRLALPFFDPQWLKQLEPYTDLPFVLTDDIDDRTIAKIDGIIESMARSDVSSDAKQKAFEYILNRNAKQNLSTQKILKKFDSLSPPPLLESYQDYEHNMGNAPSFYVLQKVQSLVEILVNHSQPQQWNTLFSALETLLRSQERFPRDTEKWLATALVPKIKKRITQPDVATEIKQSVLSRIERLNIETKNSLANELKHIAHLFNLEQEFRNRSGPKPLTQSPSTIKTKTSAIGAIDVGAAGKKLVGGIAGLAKFAGQSGVFTKIKNLTGFTRENTQTTTTALPAHVADPIGNLLERATASSDSNEIYSIFKGIKLIYETEFNSELVDFKVPSSQLVTESLRQKFIEAIYQYGTLKEKAGAHWPSVFRSKTWRGFDSSESILKSIQNYAKKHASEIDGSQLIAIINISFNIKKENDPYYRSTLNSWPSMGLNTEHLFEFIRFKNKNLSSKDRVNQWLIYVSGKDKLYEVALPFEETFHQHFQKDSKLWPLGSLQLWKMVLHEIESEIESYGHDNSLIDHTIEALSLLRSTALPNTSAVLREDIERLRYRPLLEDLSELNLLFDTLTIEEIDSSLAKILANAKTPQQHNDILKLILKLDRRLAAENLKTSGGSRGFFKELSSIYLEHVEQFYRSAVLEGNVDIIYGTGWPLRLANPGNNSSTFINLYKKLDQEFRGTPYERFRLLSVLKDNGQTMGLNEVSFLAIIEDSPHYEALSSSDQLTVLESLFTGEPPHLEANVKGLKNAYIYLKIHRLDDKPSPQGFLQAIAGGVFSTADQAKLRHNDEFYVNLGGADVYANIGSTTAAMAARSRQHSSTPDDAKDNGRAALFIDRHEPNHQRARELLRLFQHRSIPKTITELLRLQDHQNLQAPLTESEQDLALQNSLKNAKNAQEYQDILRAITKIKNPSNNLVKLLVQHIQHFATAAIELSDFSMVHFDETRWPHWILSLGGIAEKLKAQQTVFNDPRTSALESAKLLLSMAPENRPPVLKEQKGLAGVARNIKLIYQKSTAFKARMTEQEALPYYEKIRTKLTSPQEFFTIVRNQNYLMQAKSIWNLTTPSTIASHYWKFWRTDWSMTLELAMALIAEPLLWAESDGQEMSTFIRQSKNSALAEQLKEQLAVETQKDNAIRKQLDQLKDAFIDLKKAAKHLNQRQRSGRLRQSDHAPIQGIQELLNQDKAREDFEQEQKTVEINLENVRLKILKLEDQRRDLQPNIEQIQEQLRIINEENNRMQELARATQGARLKGPAYEYRLDFSEENQKRIVAALRRDHNFPSLPGDEFKLWAALASRGATAYTDLEIHRLLHSSGFECSSCIEEVLDKKLVWDFQLRKQLFDRLHVIKNDYGQFVQRVQEQKPLDRTESILGHIRKVKEIFPEESHTRAEILEEFSSSIESRLREAKIIESSKYDTNTELESAAFRLFVSLDQKLTKREERLEFLLFLQGKGPLPAPIRDLVRFGIGESRLIRQFQSFTPQMRGLLLNPLIGPPFGLMMLPDDTNGAVDPVMHAKLINLILEDAGEQKEDAQHLLNALMYALDKTEPHSKFMMVSFLLGQVGRVGGSPGEKLRVLLDFMGGTGQSLGQALVQRRSLPQEYLEHISDLQDNGRRPLRLEVYEQIAELLGVVDVDSMLEFKTLEGAGTARVVLKVKIKDPAMMARLRRMGFGVAASEHGLVAMKLLRPDIRRTTQREIEKMRYILEYLEAHAPPKFRRLRGPIEAVQRSLMVQADLSLEPKAYAKMVELYENRNANTENSGFIFRVVQPDHDVSEDGLYALEEFAEGTGLRRWALSLNSEQTAPVFSTIYEKEKSILFSEPDARGLIHFEDDRHKGNFKIDFSQQPVVISIFDYPLIATITAPKRQAVLKLLGYLGYLRNERLRMIPPLLISEMVAEFSQIAADPSGITAEKIDQLKQTFRTALHGRNDRQTIHFLLDVLAAGEGTEVPVDFSVYSYLKALSYTESYAPTPEDFENFLTEKIKSIMPPLNRSNLSLADQCAFALSSTLNALSPKQK